MNRWIFFGVFCALAAAGCGNKLPDYKKLGDLRVIALVTTTPEVAQGTAVTITPIVSDLAAAGQRTLTSSAAACIDLGVSYGATPSCAGVPGAVSIPIGAVTLSAPAYTGAGPTFIVNIPPAGITDLASAQQQFNGVSYLATYNLTASDGTQINAFRRIIVSTKSSKNIPPTLSGVTSVSQGALALVPQVSGGLTAAFASGNYAEGYSYLSSDGTTKSLTEHITLSWFLGDGTIQFTRTGATDKNNFTVGSSPNIFVVVARDDREGSSACVFNTTGKTCF